MGTTVCLPKTEYDELLKKANLFDHYVEVEELSATELIEIEKVLKGSFLTKFEFIKRHAELS